MNERLRKFLVIGGAIIVALMALMVAWATYQLIFDAHASVSEIQFDGPCAIKLDGSHTYNVESVHSTTVYTDVTITTSAVTVTIWKK
jgi:hypothetical protein